MVTQEERIRLKKRSEEIAIQLREHEDIYDKHIKESRRLLEIAEKQYQESLIKSTDKINETKFAQIEKSGKLLQKWGLVDVNKICARLKRDYKGVIKSPTYIQNCCKKINPNWVQTAKHDGTRGKRSQRTSSTAAYGMEPQTQISEPTTEQDNQYVEAVKRELITDKRIEELVILWTGKSHAAQGEIVSRTPKGKHWSQILVEESKDYMRKLAHQMTDSDLDVRLEDLRIFENVRRAFSDIVYEVRESRKKNESLRSI